MPKLTQYDDDYPIIQKQSIANKSAGFDAMAQVLGKTSDELFKSAGNMAEEASNANLMQAHSMLSDLLSNSKVQMYQDPSNAAEIYQKTAQTAKSIQSTLYVNSSDRQKYNYLQQQSLDNLNVKSQETEINLNRENAKFQTINSFNANLQNFYDTAFTDPKAAKIMLDTSINTISGLVKSGTISGPEGANLFKIQLAEVQRAKDRGSLIGNPNADASSINAISSYQPNPEPYANSNLPVNANTQSLANHHMENMSTNDMLANIAQGHPPSLIDMSKIKDLNVWNRLKGNIYGAAQAEGILNANVPWNQIKDTLSNLTAKKYSTDEEQGYRTRLSYVVDDIEKRGGYFKFITGSPGGTRDTIAYNNQAAVINSQVFSGNADQQAEARSAAQKKNVNDYFANLNARGIGMNVPDQYRNFISSQYIDPIKDGFKAQGDVNKAIDAINMLDNRNISGAANVMKTPRQALAVYEIHQLTGKADKGFLSTLLMSQQDGIDFKGLTQYSAADSDESVRVNDVKLANIVAPKISEKLSYLTRFSGGTNLYSGEIDKAVRYIKTASILANDTNLTDAKKYAQDYADNTNRAYDLSSTYNRMIDRNVIPGSDNDFDLLTQHAMNIGFDKLRKAGMNDAQLQDYISRNGPYLISSPNGRLMLLNNKGQVITDNKGNPVFSEFYNPNMLSMAKVKAQENLKNNLKKRPNLKQSGLL